MYVLESMINDFATLSVSLSYLSEIKENDNLCTVLIMYVDVLM